MNKEQARKGSRETEATPSAVLLALAERCEREEPSEALNWDIRVALFSTPSGAWVIGGPSSTWNYTTSLDAAVTLVPEMWSFTLRQNIALMPVASIWFSLRDPVFDGTARTLAMAICAAALRARAAAADASVSPERSEAVP